MGAAVASGSAAVRGWGAGTAAIARILVGAEQPMTGVAIAAAAGVTQPRASQVLRHLATFGAVRTTEHGYVGEQAQLLDLYRQRARPLLVQPESYWYSTRPPLDQARKVLELAGGRPPSVAFSADLAPDLLVPWRHPTLTIAYTTEALTLEGAGFVPAEGRADATVVLRWTSDATLLSPAAPWPGHVDGIAVTDPVTQWRDLLDLGGEDRAEAAGRLERAILERTIPAPG